MTTSILVVDDEPSVLRFFKNKLGQSGKWVVQTAKTANEALVKTDEVSPHLVLLDIRLEINGMDGIACLSEMRARGFEGTICIMTGNPSLELLFTAALAGADAFIEKNGAFSNFVWEVDNLLEMSARKRVVSLKPFDPAQHGIFLRSKGLNEAQIDILTKYANMGFPLEKDLAHACGLSASALSKRLARIKSKLGVDSMRQIVRLMTILSMYGARH